MRLGVPRRIVGRTRERRQARERHVDAKRARADAEAVHRGRELRRQRGAFDQPAVEQLRPDVRRDCARAQHLPALELDAHGAPPLHHHAPHRRLEVDLHAARSRLLGHELADASHAADGMAPAALLAVHFAEAVVQQHVGRAGRVRTRIVADHRVPAEHALEHVALEQLIEPVAGALGEDVDEIALADERQAAEVEQQPRRGHSVAPVLHDERPAEVRWRSAAPTA